MNNAVPTETQPVARPAHRPRRNNPRFRPVNVRGIPPAVHTELKLYARRHHITIGEALTTLVRAGLLALTGEEAL